MTIPLTFSLKRTVDSGEFVTVAELQEYVGIPSATTAHNGLLTALGKTARDTVETDTRRAFLKQTWVMKFDGFPTDISHIELERPPLASVTSVTYLDTSGNSQTWSTGSYEVDANREPGVVWLAFDQDWPSTRDIQNAVTVTYVAGYSTASASVPEQAHQAVKMLVSDWFHHRCVDGPANKEAYLSLIHGLRWGDYR